MNNISPQICQSASAPCLRQVSEQSGIQPLRRTILRMIGLLHALNEFHSRGRLHLSVTPDSVIIEPCGPNESVRLTAPSASSHPCFTAPEIRANPNVLARPTADLYSAAAVFHYCLTGRELSPFESIRPTPPDVTSCAALTDFPLSVRSMTNAILRCGLNPLPERRYPNVQSMISDFQLLANLIDRLQ